MLPLRPDLYKRLNSIPSLGGVIVAHQGERMSSTIGTYCGKKSLQITERGEAYRVNCPFCTDTKHRLWINHRWGMFNSETNSRNLWLCICYNDDQKCLKSFVNQKKLFDMVYDDARPPVNDVLLAGEDVDEKPHTIKWPGDVVDLYSLPENSAALNYIYSRNFNPYILSTVLKLKYCERAEPEYRLAANRIIIPFYFEGELKGWQARYIGDTSNNKSILKYWTCPGTKKSRLLYNYDIAKKYDYVVITEGPTDVWRYGPEAVAILGHNLSNIQKQLIINNWKKIIIMLDNDAIDSAQGIYDDFKGSGISNVFIATLPDKKDPGDMSTGYLRANVYSLLRSC